MIRLKHRSAVHCLRAWTIAAGNFAGDTQRFTRSTNSSGSDGLAPPMSARPKRFYKHSSPLVAKAVRDLYFIGRLKQHEIGKIFGLRQCSVSRIVSRQVWNVR